MVDRFGVGSWCAAAIATTPALRLVAWFTGVDDAVHCAGGLGADVCLLAADQATRAAIDRVRANCPGISVVLIADLATVVDRQVGVLRCPAPRGALLAAIDGKSPGIGGVARRPPQTIETADDAMSPDLSRRELEVAVLLTEGLSNRDIAHMLCISEATVKNHVHRVLAKLGTSSRSGVGVALAGHASTGHQPAPPPRLGAALDGRG